MGRAVAIAGVLLRVALAVRGVVVVTRRLVRGAGMARLGSVSTGTGVTRTDAARLRVGVCVAVAGAVGTITTGESRSACDGRGSGGRTAGWPGHEVHAVHASRGFVERALPIAPQPDGDTPTIILPGGAPRASPVVGPLAQSGIQVLKCSNSPLLPHHPGSPRAVRCSVVRVRRCAAHSGLAAVYLRSRRPVARNQPFTLSMPHEGPSVKKATASGRHRAARLRPAVGTAPGVPAAA